jgi:mono/diheme cytochrome c family protein
MSRCALLLGAVLLCQVILACSAPAAPTPPSAPTAAPTNAVAIAPTSPPPSATPPSPLPTATTAPIPPTNTTYPSPQTQPSTPASSPYPSPVGPTSTPYPAPNAPTSTAYPAPAAAALTVPQIAVTAIAAAAGEECVASGPKPAKGFVGDPTRGRALFVQRGCSTCHGDQAQGLVGPKIAGTTLAFGAVIQQLREPRGVMQRYLPKDQSDADECDVYTYVKGLKP